MGSVRCPVFLLVLLYSTMGHKADAVIKLDTFPDVVDYSGCRDEMLTTVTKPGDLLQREFNNSSDFRSMWKGSATCAKKIPGAKPEHMAALKSYADADQKFHKLFNTKLQSNIKNITVYQNEFPFKSLYFLLTDAMQLLSKGTCQTVYSSIEKKDVFRVGDSIRFGTFMAAKPNYLSALEDIIDVGGTVFNITSCSVVNLDERCQSEEIDLLISPTEAFNVKSVSRTEDEEIRVFALVPHSIESSYDCRSLFRTASSKSEDSSSNLLSSSLMNLMAPFVMVYISTLNL